MPFKSEAQRRKFYAMKERGEISGATVEEYQQETKGDIPDRVAKYKKAKEKTVRYKESKEA